MLGKRSSALSAKSRANAVTNGNIVHLSVRRLSKYAGAVGAWGRTMLIQTPAVSESKAIRTEWVAVDLAKIETDAIVGGVDCILELEDWLGDLSWRLADLDTASIIGVRDVSFVEGARVRGDRGNTGAARG